MPDEQHRRGERKGQAVEKKPTGVAERRADRAAGREGQPPGALREPPPQPDREERSDYPDRQA